jgi:hypothetical protein
MRTSNIQLRTSTELAPWLDLADKLKAGEQRTPDPRLIHECPY